MMLAYRFVRKALRGGVHRADQTSVAPDARHEPTYDEGAERERREAVGA